MFKQNKCNRSAAFFSMNVSRKLVCTENRSLMVSLPDYPPGIIIACLHAPYLSLLRTANDELAGGCVKHSGLALHTVSLIGWRGWIMAGIHEVLSMSMPEHQILVWVHSRSVSRQCDCLAINLITSRYSTGRFTLLHLLCHRNVSHDVVITYVKLVDRLLENLNARQELGFDFLRQEIQARPWFVVVEQCLPLDGFIALPIPVLALRVAIDPVVGARFVHRPVVVVVGHLSAFLPHDESRL